MIHLTIDGIAVEVEKGTTILQAAKQIGVKIPTLCYLENVLPDAPVGGDACMTLLPSQFEDGDVLPDAAFTLTAAGIPYKVEVSGREYLRRETISTAAGEFDCVVVFALYKKLSPLLHSETGKKKGENVA